MLRLNLSRAPSWLTIAEGVRILLLPADIELVTESQSDPAFRAALGDGDLPETDAAALAMDPLAKSRIGTALAIAMAKRAIIEWEGMEDEDGKPLLIPSDAGVEALLRIPSVFRLFQEKYMGPAMNLAAEGNASGPSLNGTSAAVLNTARPVPRAAKPVPKSKARH